ncbi:MAG: thioesterase family protein [Acidocella sp.]|nr:thioesterase family protein [Acidocella sp.]
MAGPSAFITHPGCVRDGWVDDNNHMNLAYYLVLFDVASDAAFETLGIGTAYRQAAGCTSFAAETHLVYEREMNFGDAARIVTTVLNVDEKRLHLAHEMYRGNEPSRVCLQEIMFINVDLKTRRATPWASSASARLLAVCAEHQSLPRPAKCGRSVGVNTSWPKE